MNCKCGRRAKAFYQDQWLCKWHADELCNMLVDQEREISRVRQSIYEQMYSEPCEYCGRIDPFNNGRSMQPLVCIKCHSEGKRLPKDNAARVSYEEDRDKWRTSERKLEWLKDIVRKTWDDLKVLIGSKP